MTIKFLDLYNECTSQPWSMYDNEIESIADAEPAMVDSINKAIAHVWNLYPWTFRKYSLNLKTRPTKSLYTIPSGKIATKTISGSKKHCVRYDGKYLDYTSDYTILEPQEGEPECFYVDGEDFYVYPTPDDNYTISIDYYLLPFGVKKDGTELYELADDNDEINVPEKYETIFKNVVITKAMLYAITDQSDENDSGYREQYQEALKILLDNCYDGTREKRVVI